MFLGTAGSSFSMTSQPLISQTTAVRRCGRPRDLRFSDLEVEFVDPLRDSNWDRLVLSHPESTVFHSGAWAAVLVTTYGHEPFYLRFARHGETVALMPFMEVRSPFTGRRGVCLPFSDFCEPLTFAGCKSDIVIAKLTELARERDWKYFEVRGGTAFQAGAAPVTTFYGHCLDLRGDVSALPARFESSVRRAIRKAEKSALVAQVDSSRAGILEFYKLHIRTRRRHGIPPQPLSFFLNIYESVIKPGLGFVVLARRASKPAAAAVFFHRGKKAIYKFGASDETLQELRGNNLVIWEGIKFLVCQGAESLHFGRTSLDDHGLRTFKLSWGTDEEIIKYLRLDAAADTWVSQRNGEGPGYHKKIFSRLPLPLNRLAGSMVYPHLD